MAWNWTYAGWPTFRFDQAALTSLEEKFLLASGEVIGAVKHVGSDQLEQFRIEILAEEAVRTSQIEGEILDRASVQSSLRRQFGLSADAKRAKPQERGIAELMADLFEGWDRPLTHETLFRWHGMLMAGNDHLIDIGRYRTHQDAMQIVSGQLHDPTIHFEAPPSVRVPAEMAAYIDWFNASAPGSTSALPALTRAGIGHLYFESIHPFEDGNGRLGRALAEKSLAQNLGQPSLISLAYTIERNRKSYYDQLARHQVTLDITEWLFYFGQTILDAQQATMARLSYSISRTRFHDRFRGAFNERQDKVINRMFREGIDGFKGGLSAENYIAITKTSRATATRDLADLVLKGALKKTGALRHTRYTLDL